MSGRIAFLLPGQGAQHVGMGHDLYRRFPEVRHTFRDAPELLGFSSEQLCFDGPAAELQPPENCRIEIKGPRIPIVGNVTARPISHPPTIRKHVVDQLTAPVRWTEPIQWLLHHGMTTFVEVGPGKILTNSLRSVANHKSIFAYHTSTAEALDKVLKKLGGDRHGSR